MTIQYDPEADAAYIRLTDAHIVRTEEASDVCVLDLDAQGSLVAVELLSVFGFAGASLQGLVQKGLLSQARAESLLKELRSELVAA